ncbi:uncharacterized protein KY384_009193 [Bacidia gigantensis]|uniref:uncharacterized protein n=1 Tax=Bacidia gigantensis TaxID=2732470 RepID=UPI001D056F4A|nr:uncharacterized protein KY384_009193 [Bacidia gigantensis]KAG8525549.1 hypothetical protein KY384_009193 [Bacidia gigantensis]
MSYDTRVRDAIDLHLKCERRDFQPAPSFKSSGYGEKERTATMKFHITFYEIYTQELETKQDIWKIGELYNDPEKRRFRECSCTLLAIGNPAPLDIHSWPDSLSSPEYWTILYLTPEGFGKPIGATGHMDLAVLSLVTNMLMKVTDRWADLVDFLRTLLESSSLFLDPVRHDNLLFDNEDFTRSREQFWAINCLAEFESSIFANIEQWEEFRRYLTRLEPSNKKTTSPLRDPDDELLEELLGRSDGYCTRLKRYHSFFQTKRAATITLRDGVSKEFRCITGTADAYESREIPRSDCQLLDGANLGVSAADSQWSFTRCQWARWACKQESASCQDKTVGVLLEVAILDRRRH